VATLTVLVTGGAGFIGSFLVARLLSGGQEVRVLDNFSTGLRANVDPHAEVYDGDLTDEEAVRKAVTGVEIIFHEAALTSVARSVEHPLAADLTNSHGTLNLLAAARDAGARRLVYASSSSVYGGAGPVPSVETAQALPRSPYAVSKLAGEHYCRVFSQLYGLETVALRYFNVYGPRQRPGSAYAAAVPLFIQAFSEGRAPMIYGDGLQSRDFTFVEDVVEANIAAARAPVEASGHVFNVACGRAWSLLEVLEVLRRVMGVAVTPVHAPERAGDVRNSLANVDAARRLLGFEAKVGLEEGLTQTVDWFRAFQASGTRHRD
jgi:nucleoside-diphosphate-sugar epimerase